MNYLTNVYVDKDVYNPMENNFSSQDIQRLIKQHIKTITFVDNVFTVTFIDNTTFVCYYKNKSKKNKLFKDSGFSIPLVVPTIHHNGDRFEIKNPYTN